MKLSIVGEEFELLPERAFFWEKEKLLGFSDVHVGKAESFQKLGIPVPTGSHQEDFAKISVLVERFHPRVVLILGDWIHQKSSWTAELMTEMKEFFGRYPGIRWVLLIGNHERGSLNYLRELPLEIVEGTFSVGEIDFTHGHEGGASDGDASDSGASDSGTSEGAGRFRVEGHVHPVVTLSDGPLRMRFPCFVLSSDRLLIPSFGSFTGGAEVERSRRRSRSERLFAVTPQEVFEIR